MAVLCPSVLVDVMLSFRVENDLLLPVLFDDIKITLAVHAVSDLIPTLHTTEGDGVPQAIVGYLPWRHVAPKRAVDSHPGGVSSLAASSTLLMTTPSYVDAVV